MNLSDFSITKIELTDTQADALFDRIIDAIDKHGIHNFESKTEIQVPEINEGHDVIEVYLNMETYTESSDGITHIFDYPEPENISSRSIMKLKIQLINEGSEVECDKLDYIFEKVTEYYRI